MFSVSFLYPDSYRDFVPYVTRNYRTPSTQRITTDTKASYEDSGLYTRTVSNIKIMASVPGFCTLKLNDYPHITTLVDLELCDHKHLSTESQAGDKEQQEYTMDTTKVKE